MLAYETAADYLGMANGGMRENLMIFVEKSIGIPDVREFVVSSFADIKTMHKKGMICTTPEQTIINLLELDENEQIIYEVLANYYFNHDRSFGLLKIPHDLEKRFHYYADYAVHYYEE